MRVYFIDLIHPSGTNNTNVMPLGMGLIAAYCQKYEPLWEIEIFKLPDDLNRALKSKPLPDVACFSNWIWNQQLQLAYARHLKQLKPEMAIIMGGLNFPLDQAGREAFLRAHPEITSHVIGEGEEAILSFLWEFKASKMKLDEMGYYDFEGCAYLHWRGGYRETSLMHNISLDDIPSPYVSGLMDKFFFQGLRPIIETARGCPFGCIFCAAAGGSHRVLHHSPAYIETELNYIADKIKEAGISPDLIYADLNFGMFSEDVEKARIFRRIIDRHGWPRTISGSTGKANAEQVLEAVEIINRGPDGKDEGILKFAASLQSTDPEVLSLCGRHNFSMDRLERLMAKRPKGSPAEYFSELIVGLPGDTKEKHFQSLRDCIDRLRLNLIVAHQLMVLPGTPLATPEMRTAHGLKTRWRPLVGCAGIYRIGNEDIPIAELEEIALETVTMSLKDHIECREMDLLTKIYIDRDAFIEIFGLIRRLGLSCFDLLFALREKSTYFLRFNRFLEDFRHATFSPFFENTEELEGFTSKKDNVRQIFNGKLGTNELLVYRGKAFTGYWDEIHNALWQITCNYIRRHGIFTESLGHYINQSISWSMFRKFDPTTLLNTEKKDAFFYDFLAATERGFEILPEEIVLSAPRRYRFVYSAEQQARIRSLISWWIPCNATITQQEYNWGRFYHIINTKTLDRTPILMED